MVQAYMKVMLHQLIQSVLGNVVITMKMLKSFFLLLQHKRPRSKHPGSSRQAILFCNIKSMLDREIWNWKTMSIRKRSHLYRPSCSSVVRNVLKTIVLQQNYYYVESNKRLLFSVANKYVLRPILYYTILYYTILYYTILYQTILYYTILYYTILIFQFWPKKAFKS